MKTQTSQLIIDNSDTGFDYQDLPLAHAHKLTQAHLHTNLNITLVFTSIDQMFTHNTQLRGKNKPTDVISLPTDQNTGDIFLCPEFIYEQGYTNDRIIHLWVHSLLHIAGFLHDTDEQFQEMSQHEIDILQKLHIEDPYAE